MLHVVNECVCVCVIVLCLHICNTCVCKGFTSFIVCVCVLSLVLLYFLRLLKWLRLMTGSILRILIII